MAIRAAVVGVGNVGKACVEMIEANRQAFGDFELSGVISSDPKRASKDLPGVKIYGWDDFQELVGRTDVLFNGGGSKNGLFGDEKEVRKILADKDLVDRLIADGGQELLKLGQGPFFASYFPVSVDSFDDHPRIASYYDVINRVTKEVGGLALISAGWDPGTGSEARIAFDAYAIGEKPKPFYGLGDKGGKSMGHSNALLTIPGVKRGIQYTHAIPELIERVRRGESIGDGEKTVTREVIVVLNNDVAAERARVDETVKGMEDYFTGYKTSVSFVDDATFEKEHANAKQHDGVFIARGKTGPYVAKHELHCSYESNAHGTAGIMLAGGRGAYKLWCEGKSGACIFPDIPVSYRSPRSREELLKSFM
jgi:diaminopimelate dehydrogenase